MENMIFTTRKREVTKEEFFKVIGPKDVIVTPKGKFPYYDDFTMRETILLVGRIEDELLNPGKILHHYFLYD